MNKQVKSDTREKKSWKNRPLRISTIFILSLMAISALQTTSRAGEDLQKSAGQSEKGKLDRPYLRNVKFKIMDGLTGEPLTNRELNICHFVCFKLKPNQPSPYLDKTGQWYITSIITDNNGVFSLDLSLLGAGEFVVEPNEPYMITIFERSSDIAHTPSLDHIRIYEGNRNLIYDLGRKIVKIIPIDDQKEEEKPYKEIILKVERNKKPTGWKRGNSVYGLQCQLKAEKKVWKADEIPILKANVRNNGKLEFKIIPHQAECELIINGQRYRSRIRLEMVFSPFPPEQEYHDINIPLDDTWWTDGQPYLKLKSRTYTVQAVFFAWSKTTKERIPFSSNPVEIEIADQVNSAGDGKK